MTIDVIINTHLNLRRDQLTDEQLDRLKQALTIADPDKERAVREEVWGADEWPDNIHLWETEGESVLLPRGIGDMLDLILQPDKLLWIDQRTDAPMSTSLWRNPLLRDYQEQAALTLMAHDQGVYEAPTGSGKTVTMLEVIRRLGRKALVIVNSTHIAEQWRERASQHLGVMPGLIGDGVWQEEPGLNVALQQTLWARRDSLDGWWENWGLIVLDECHHVPARTFYDVIQRFPARYRYGLSATPEKQEGWERLVRASIGPVVHTTDEEPLIQAGVIHRPEVRILSSSFETDFWPTHRAHKNEDGVLTCTYPKCNRTGLVHRNNWSDIVKELVDDAARNDLIATEIAKLLGEGRAIIVLSRRLGHLDNLARRVGALVGTENLYRLSGKEKTKTRMETYERAERGNIAIFATVGDEALDIPRLDTVVLAFPTKNAGLIEQQIGRASRAHPDKAPPLVIDVADPMSVLDNQLKSRMRVYRRKRLTVTNA